MVNDSEYTDEQKSERFDINRYLNVVRRRHMHFLIAMLLGWLVVWGTSWVLPSRYKSGTLIMVEQPSVPSNYVEPNVSDDLQDRLQSITQQILSRTRILSIIEKLHLYEDGRTKLTADEKVEKMRKDIDIQLERDSINKKITAFRVFYSAHDPRVAQQVTGELTDLFIDENLKLRQQASIGTTTFIESQLENARASLAEQEAKVRDFQSKHEGELPSQQATNLQILSGLQAQLQNEQGSLNNAKQQRVYYQALIEQYRALKGTSQTADGATTSLPAIDQELEKLKTQLTSLSAHYTDHYPDVQAVKHEIAKTEKMRDQLIADIKKNGNSGKQSSDTAVSIGTNPALNSPLMQLQGQLQANQIEIGNREQAIAALKGRINEYQIRLNNQPASEQQLADLTRGYDQSKVNYDSLLKKKNDSAMATAMEQTQQGERFKMLDPPSLPDRPDFPNRLKFCGIGLGVGLALGLVIAGGLEFLDDRMYSEQEIKAMLPVAVLTEIPEITLPSEERLSKKRTALGWAMAGFVVVTILAGSAFTYLHD